MWDMLILRCPSLRALTLKGPSGQPFDCINALQGRWTKLERLAISTMAYDHQLVDFLTFHSQLQHLDLEWTGTEEHRLSTEATHSGQPMQPFELVNLRTFLGHLHFATKILANPADIKSLDISYTMLLPRAVSSTRSFLSSLASLSSLTIGLFFSNPHDTTSIFSVLAAACPRLTFLHLIGEPAIPLVRGPPSIVCF